MKSIDQCLIFVPSCALLLAGGCTESTEPAAPATAEDHGHEHGTSTPHGGTPVMVGDHGYHLELVNDPTEGKMLAYVLDGHMEKYVKVPLTSFELIARTAGEEHRLTFNSVTNPPNGTSTNTSLFSASGAWLTSETNSFEGSIPKIVLDGKTFENITFTYPKGTRHEH